MSQLTCLLCSCLAAYGDQKCQRMHMRFLQGQCLMTVKWDEQFKGMYWEINRALHACLRKLLQAAEALC